MRAIELRGIDHVVLRVADMERALQFYVDVLGCREERRVESLGLVQLRAGSSLIDLVHLSGELGRAGGAGPGKEGHNVDHFAVRLGSFHETEMRRLLEAHGVEPGDVVQRYGAEGMGPSMYVQDPDGNTVELKGPPTSSG